MVPALVGLPIGAAHELAFEVGVVVVSGDPEDPLPASGVVTAQQPLAGTSLPAAGSVAVLVDPGGGGGSRVPAEPTPLDAAGA